jgi:hypothetical protein
MAPAEYTLPIDSKILRCALTTVQYAAASIASEILHLQIGGLRRRPRDVLFAICHALQHAFEGVDPEWLRQ